MATVDFYVWKRPAKDGKFPISVRITIARKPSYIMTGQKLDNLDQWDAKKQKVKSSHPNSTRLNNYLRNELAKANDKSLEMETQATFVSAREVKKGIKPKEDKPIYFLEIANQYLNEQLACGNYDVYNTDTSRIKRFYEFANQGKLSFPEITPDLLNKFVIYLKQAKKRNGKKGALGRPLSERTITNHLILIRTIYNRAVLSGIASKDQYPFGANGKITISISNTQKIGLQIEEIQMVENLDLTNATSIINYARDMWLFEYYFAGMRVTDCLLLKWTDFQNGRLYYAMSKNGEPGHLKVPEKAAKVLERYQYMRTHPQNKNCLVFPLLMEIESLDDRLELRRQISYAVSRLNKAMRRIMQLIGSTKNASQHKARHTFAQRAEEKEIHPKVLQKMYRHESILTTMIYQSNFSHKKADEALDAVIGL